MKAAEEIARMRAKLEAGDIKPDEPLFVLRGGQLERLLDLLIGHPKQPGGHGPIVDGGGGRGTDPGRMMYELIFSHVSWDARPVQGDGLAILRIAYVLDDHKVPVAYTITDMETGDPITAAELADREGC